MNTQRPVLTSQATDQFRLRSTIDLMEILWRRKYFLALGIVTGIVLGASYYFSATPLYRSSAEVLVVRKRPGVVTGEQRYESGFEDYVATQRALIVSPLIVQRAIDTAGLGSLHSLADFESEEDLTDAVIGMLEVGSGARDLGDGADSIMILSFQGTDPDECPLVVQAVVESYKAFLSEIYRGMSDDTLRLVGEARDLLNNDLQQQEEAYANFRQQSPLVTRGTDEVNPLQDRLTAIETQRSQLVIRRAEMERQKMVLENAKSKGLKPQQLLALISDLRHRATSEDVLPNTSAALETQLFQLVDRQQKLLEHFGPNHPHVLTLRDRIAATRKFLTLPTAAHLQTPAASEAHKLASDDADAVQAYGQYLEEELEQIRISEEQLTKLYEREHQAAKELSSYQLKDERFRRNIDLNQQLYDGVISQLQDANLVKDYGGFEAHVIAPPRPGEKVHPSGRLILAASMLVGAVLGFFGTMAAELTDKSFRSRDEIQVQLGLPVLGQIPQFSAAKTSERPNAAGQVAMDPMLCTYFQPRSLQTEAYRALRTALFCSSRAESCRVLQVTGASPDDGTSTLAANLAVAIAQSGKRVLLIDADLRRPRQHEIFGIAGQRGLDAVVASDEELNDVIRQTAVDNLWLLPAGPLPADPSETFTSPRFPALVDVVRQQYDYVLVDTGPLLVVSDPCIVATRTDGILLALRLTKNSRRRAQRAQEILDTVDAKLVGVVANGIGGVGSGGYQHEWYADYDGYRENGESPSPQSANSLASV